MKPLAVALVVASLSLAAGVRAAPRLGHAAPPVVVPPFATGLNNPRGLAFGPDGDLYVAEGGIGGPATTNVTQCQQVLLPIGPYSGGFTSSISKIDPAGVRTTVAENLPSSQTSLMSGSLVSGVAAVAFIGDQLYGIEAGAGCSHGLYQTDNTVFRINRNGPPTQIADLSAFQKAHPVVNPNPDDFEPDGTWYSMIAVRGYLYAVEPNHGEIDRIDPATGDIARVVDISASEGHIVPTAIAYHGNFFFGNLGLFPVNPGSSAIYKVTPSGQITTTAQGLTTVLGIAFDNTDRMYVLESMTAPGFPGPQDFGTGTIVRIDPNGSQHTIATGFSFPTALTMGPDGALYVSNVGFGGPVPGLGEIQRITIQ